METKDFLRSLVNADGVSGYEAGIAELIEDVFLEFCDSVERDKLGNLIALKRGEGNNPRPKIMLAAHMDEIGLIVTKIDKDGFLRFTEVGGFDPRTLLAQEVTVHGRRKLPGIIGVKPPHIVSPEESKKATPMNEMFIDIGLPEKEARELVSVGDTITINRRFTEMQNNSAFAKAFDDRAGVAVLHTTMKQLSNLKHKADIFFVATVQEEITLGGAFVSTYGLIPDIGIAIDVGHGNFPGSAEYETIEMGKGPGISMGANIHPYVYKELIATAEAHKISHQKEIVPGASGTDAWAMQIVREGVATAVISIPLRYMHTSVETLVLDDIEETGRLLAHFLTRIDVDWMGGLGYVDTEVK